MAMKFIESVSNMIDGVASSMATLSNSYIYTGAQIATPGNKSNSRLNVNSDVYYEYLDRYHFISAVLDIFTTTIHEALLNTELKVTIKNKAEGELVDKCNSFFSSSDLKQFIISRSRNFIYRGKYSIGLDIPNGKIYEIENPYSAIMVTKNNIITGYQLDNYYIDRTKLCTYYYKADNIKPIISRKIKDKSDKDLYEKIIVKYNRFDGISIFRNQLSKIFQMYTLEYALFYLGLRDTLRPELLGMSSGGRSINAAQAIQMSNNIEALLNQATQGLANIVDPIAFMNNLTFQILNYVKVVPSVDQYTNINDIPFGDLSNKRERLSQELEKNKRDILNDLTIPEELFGGTSNRWEVMSRNDRFMTTNDNMLNSIERFIKDICISIAKYDGVSLGYDDIQFNLEYTSYLRTYDVKNKLASLADKFRDVETIMASCQNMSQFELVNKEKLFDYMKSQLNGIDDKLFNIFFTQKEYEVIKQMKDQEGTEDQGMNRYADRDKGNDQPQGMQQPQPSDDQQSDYRPQEQQQMTQPEAMQPQQQQQIPEQYR